MSSILGRVHVYNHKSGALGHSIPVCEAELGGLHSPLFVFISEFKLNQCEHLRHLHFLFCLQSSPEHDLVLLQHGFVTHCKHNYEYHILLFSLIAENTAETIVLLLFFVRFSV